MTGQIGSTNEKPEVCIIGLGYVGLTLAVAMANAGFRVKGVEKVASIRKTITKGKAHFWEAGLDEPLADHVSSGKMSCSSDVASAADARVFIITVGTPLGKDGAVNLKPLKNVLADVANVLKNGDLVVLRSTVKPGTSRAIAKRALDASGKDYDLAFCPERTLEGKALKELSSLPQIAGGLTPRAVEHAARIFSAFSPSIIRMESLEAAEIVKLINNTHRDLMFAFANEIAEMCDATGVASTQVIRAACENYPRSVIPQPGPVGGPCLEKDPHILSEGLREVGYTPHISNAGRKLNEELPRNSVMRIGKLLAEIGAPDLKAGKISILGLAFKGVPETNDLRGTMAAHILTAAKARWPTARYAAFDPVVDHSEFSEFQVDVAKILEDAFDGASLVLIQNNHRLFSQMPLAALAARMAKPALIYDYWNLFDARSVALPSGRYYAGLGTASNVQLSSNFQESMDRQDEIAPVLRKAVRQ